MEPNAPSDATSDSAYDIAFALAQAAGEGDDGAALLDTLLTHELAIGHTLMARLAAGADGFIRRIGQTPEGEPDRAVIEAARLTGVVARMMERYRLGFMTLAKVRAMPNGAKQKMIVRLAWGDGTWDDRPDRSGGGSEGNGGSGSSSGPP